MSDLEKFDKDKFIDNLKTHNIGKEIIHFDTIDSTNVEAKRLIKDNLKHGTLIIADKQSSGSGRFRRKWDSPCGGLWFTIMLKPNLKITEVPKITIVAGAAIYKALNKINIKTKIKWPNDIYLNEKKLCGILTEKKEEYIILGIGININIEEKDMDCNIKNSATSLKREYKKDFNKYEILINILYEFETLYNKFVIYNDLSEVIEICRNNSCLIGKKANLIIGNNKEEILCKGISDNGNLLAEDLSGFKKEIYSGEITFKI